MDEILTKVSNIDELLGLKEYLNDPDLDKALEHVVKLKANPLVKMGEVGALITGLQAISAVAQMKASYYQNVEKGNVQKKNVYKSLQDALDKLVAALKYQGKP